MSKYQKRVVQLSKGRTRMTLSIDHGHVWVRDREGGSGNVLYDEEEERKLLEKLLREYKKKGFKIVEDSGLIPARRPKRPSGVDAKTWRWMQDADESLKLWRDEDYDNYKDAILDARSLIAEAPTDQRARVVRLEKMLARATKELAALAASNPELAEYARGLLEPVKSAKPKKAARAAKKRPTAKRSKTKR